MNWTKEQREAIEYGGENILLAAAAGSGKTAVLVQRIIELISPMRADGTKNENPADIGELLVLTFTDAAASEMRDKIANAIRSALEQNPEDRHLKKQSIMVNSADISTIHSFCLNVLKSNIHLTDLPVDFVPASNEESTMLLSDAIDSVLQPHRQGQLVRTACYGLWRTEKRFGFKVAHYLYAEICKEYAVSRGVALRRSSNVQAHREGGQP